LFEDAYPEFISKHVLKAEQFLLLRDFPREIAALEYADFSDGVLFGCRAVAGEALTVRPGVVLYGGALYRMTKPFLLPYEPRDAATYVNILFSDEAVTEEDVTVRRSAISLCDSPAGAGGIELARFKLKSGARLRDDYTDFGDLDTEYDTLNPIYAPCASKGGKTLLPHVTEFFAKEALSFRPKDPADICFAMLCFAGDRVPLPLLQSYLETKSTDPHELYRSLQRKLAVIRSGRSAEAREERILRKIFVD
jgi:hypothetical protein